MKLTRIPVLAAALVALAGSAQAGLITYVANLSGSAEAPANASPGTGFARIDLDDVARTMRVRVDFSDLLGNVTASHIHCCTTNAGTGTAGVATVTPTFTGFPSGVTAGSYDFTFDMTRTSGSWNNAFLVANGNSTDNAFATLAGGLEAGKAYLNVHTNRFPGGEIRGFLQVPEPQSLALALAALAGLAWSRRARPGA